MSDTEKLVLSDPDIVPDDKLIFSIIGNKKSFWIAIMDHVNDNYKDISSGWRYYNDGKQWLFKLTQKKKTIFWAAILEDTFRVTFYFGDKAESLIDNSDLPQKIKDDFKGSKRYGSIRVISMKMSDLTDIENAKKLISIKTKLK